MYDQLVGQVCLYYTAGPISAHVIVNLSNKGPKGHITVRLVGNILYLINVGCTIGPVYSAYVGSGKTGDVIGSLGLGRSDRWYWTDISYSLCRSMLYQVFIYAIFQGCYIVTYLLGWYFMQDI